jgi:hypothetical protein
VDAGSTPAVSFLKPAVYQDAASGSVLPRDEQHFTWDAGRGVSAWLIVGCYAADNGTGRWVGGIRRVACQSAMTVSWAASAQARSRQEVGDHANTASWP